MNKGSIHQQLMIPANHQTAKVFQPGYRPLHNPAATETPKLATILSARLRPIVTMRANHLQTPTFQAIPQRVGIVSSVDYQIPLSITKNSRISQCRFEQRDLVRGRACQVHSDRKTLAARHHHKLCTFSTLGRTHAFAPFFAGEKVPSAKISIQLSWPCSSSSWIRAIHARSHRPCSSQSRKRLQQVLYEGYRSGKSFQRAPLRRTQRIPSKQARLFAGGRPPLVDFRGLGSKGLIFSHCWSVMIFSSLAIVLPPFDDQVKHKCVAGASLYFN